MVLSSSRETPGARRGSARRHYRCVQILLFKWESRRDIHTRSGESTHSPWASRRCGFRFILSPRISNSWMRQKNYSMVKQKSFEHIFQEEDHQDVIWQVLEAKLAIEYIHGLLKKTNRSSDKSDFGNVERIGNLLSAACRKEDLQQLLDFRGSWDYLRIKHSAKDFHLSRFAFTSPSSSVSDTLPCRSFVSSDSRSRNIENKADTLPEDPYWVLFLLKKIKGDKGTKTTPNWSLDDLVSAACFQEGLNQKAMGIIL